MVIHITYQVREDPYFLIGTGAKKSRFLVVHAESEGAKVCTAELRQTFRPHTPPNPQSGAGCPVMGAQLKSTPVESDFLSV